ncbi:hypothetical protein SRB5_52050 [Streptomyces sp. RB5]|uniref:SH3 domain-containing protein n=1 Tax=Streptomyces smaragdinus TaxID=2585196 RepID=A0A7K0CNH6_9ACTN|nr:hypothetical protein [Streptomyces smaragdinus]MQY15028.1 hypothetical protein [Streptomyces smaragdinus]
MPGKLTKLMTFEWPERLMPGYLLRRLRTPKVLAGLAAGAVVLSGIGFMAVAAWQQGPPAGEGERSAKALSESGRGADDGVPRGGAGGSSGTDSADSPDTADLSGSSDRGGWFPDNSGHGWEPPVSGLTYPPGAARAVVTAKGGVLVLDSVWHINPAINVLARGEQAGIKCKVAGRDVYGNGIWFKLAGNPGFVPARYVKNVDPVRDCRR